MGTGYQCGGTGVQFQPMGCELQQLPALRYQYHQQPYHRGELFIGTVIGEFNATDARGTMQWDFNLGWFR